MLAETFVLQAGAGPRVVCVHANAGTSGQWRSLAETLAPRFDVRAPDLYDAGKGPAWRTPRLPTLSDEAALVAPLLGREDAPAVLVGHSYGAAVALVAAVAHPGRVRALALYEPTLFALIDAQRPPPNDADGIRRAVADASAALDAGDADAAAARFIDYWMGDGAFAALPPSRQAPIAAAVTNVRRWAHALTTEPTSLDAIARLDMPILLMSGARSPASAQGVTRLLTEALPRAKKVVFDGVGHMGPVTHPSLVNPVIAAFLERLPGAS